MISLSLDSSNIYDTADVHTKLTRELYELDIALELPNWWLSKEEKLEARINRYRVLAKLQALRYTYED